MGVAVGFGGGCFADRKSVARYRRARRARAELRSGGGGFSVGLKNRGNVLRMKMILPWIMSMGRNGLKPMPGL
ncbi:hypothetical protein NL676_038144 [Syzygium grande]|nr:hypothetical protein NL676_038144 [Syzygium grande]